MTKTIGEMFDAALRVSVPIVVLRAADQWAAQEALVKRLPEEMLAWRWDAARGIAPINKKATELKKGPGQNAYTALMVDQNADFATAMAALHDTLPEGSVVFAHNAHRQLNAMEPPTCATAIQAVSNLRDVFKLHFQMLVLMGDLGFTIPPELLADVCVLDDELPSQEALKTLVGQMYEAAKKNAPDVEDPTPEKLDAAAEALSGLPEFTAEQETAMSFNADGLDISMLWERKRKSIERTPGLSVWRGTEKFDDLIGLNPLKVHLRRRLHGRRPLGVVVWIDEIDKALANVEHDTSGVRMYQLLKLLTEMENNEWSGFVGVGVPGGGKSLVAKALGNEAGVPTVGLDFGASESSLVGESEGNLNRIIQVIKAIGRGNAYFVATSNAATVMRPELQSRFSDGMWMFDLMTAQERAAAWRLYIARYDLGNAQPPTDDGWTGREIRNCCRYAHDVNCSLQEAASIIVPITRSRGDEIESLRQFADGRFLDATNGGYYHYDPKPMEKQLRGIRLPRNIETAVAALTLGGMKES